MGNDIEDDGQTAAPEPTEIPGARPDDFVDVAAPPDDYIDAPEDPVAARPPAEPTLSQRSGQRAYDANVAKIEKHAADLDYFDARQAAIAARKAQQAQKKEHNAAARADSAATGRQYNYDGEGVAVPRIDPLTKQQAVVTRTSPVRYDDKGRPFQTILNEGGIPGKNKIVNPDAKADIGENPDDLNDPNIYRKNKATGWEAIDPETGIHDPDNAVAVASAKALHRRELAKAESARTDVNIALGDPKRPNSMAPAARLTIEAERDSFAAPEPQPAPKNSFFGGINAEATAADQAAWNAREEVRKSEHATREAILARDDERSALEQKRYELDLQHKGLKDEGPAGFLQRKRSEKAAELGALPPEQAGPAIESKVSDIQTTDAQLQSEQALLQRRADEHTQKRAAGGTADQMAQWDAEAAGIQADGEALNSKFQQRNAQVATVQSGIEAQASRRKEEIKAGRAKMRENPATAPFADQFDSLDTEAETRAAAVQALPEGPGKAAAAKALQEELKAKSQGIESEYGIAANDGFPKSLDEARWDDADKKAWHALPTEKRIQWQEEKRSRSAYDEIKDQHDYYSKQTFEEWKSGNSDWNSENRPNATDEELRAAFEKSRETMLRAIRETYKKKSPEHKAAALDIFYGNAGSPEGMKKQAEAMYAENPVEYWAGQARKSGQSYHDFNKAALGLLAHVTGNKEFAAAMLQNSQDSQAEMAQDYPSLVDGVKNVRTKGDAAVWAAQGIISLAPQIAESITSATVGFIIGASGGSAVPGAGTAVGGIGGFFTGLFAKSAIKAIAKRELLELGITSGVKTFTKAQIKAQGVKILAREGSEELLKSEFKTIGAKAGMLLGSFGSSYKGNGAEIYLSLMGDPEIDPDTAAATTLLFAVPSAAMDVAGELLPISKMLGLNKGAAKAIVEGSKKYRAAVVRELKDFGISVAGEATGEGGQALNQFLAQRFAKHGMDFANYEPLKREEWDEFVESTAQGALGGGVFGAGGTIGGLHKATSDFRAENAAAAPTGPAVPGAIMPEHIAAANADFTSYPMPERAPAMAAGLKLLTGTPVEALTQAEQEAINDHTAKVGGQVVVTDDLLTEMRTASPAVASLMDSGAIRDEATRRQEILKGGVEDELASEPDNSAGTTGGASPSESSNNAVLNGPTTGRKSGETVESVNAAIEANKSQSPPLPAGKSGNILSKREAAAAHQIHSSLTKRGVKPGVAKVFANSIVRRDGTDNWTGKSAAAAVKEFEQAKGFENPKAVLTAIGASKTSQRPHIEAIHSNIIGQLQSAPKVQGSEHYDDIAPQAKKVLSAVIRDRIAPEILTYGGAIKAIKATMKESHGSGIAANANEVLELNVGGMLKRHALEQFRSDVGIKKIIEEEVAHLVQVNVLADQGRAKNPKKYAATHDFDVALAEATEIFDDLPMDVKKQIVRVRGMKESSGHRGMEFLRMVLQHDLSLDAEGHVIKGKTRITEEALNAGTLASIRKFLTGLLKTLSRLESHLKESFKNSPDKGKEYLDRLATIRAQSVAAIKNFQKQADETRSQEYQDTYGRIRDNAKQAGNSDQGATRGDDSVHVGGRGGVGGQSDPGNTPGSTGTAGSRAGGAGGNSIAGGSSSANAGQDSTGGSASVADRRIAALEAEKADRQAIDDRAKARREHAVNVRAGNLADWEKVVATVSSDTQEAVKSLLGDSVKGRPTYVLAVNNSRIPAVFVALPPRKLQASHTGEQFAKNPEYAGQNTRAYDTDEAEQNKVRKGALPGALNEDILTSNDPSAANGSPQSAIVIDSDKDGNPRARWQAAGGNARVMMTNLAPLEDQERLSEAWESKAGTFGFDSFPAGWTGSRFLGVFDIRTPEGAAKYQKLVDDLNPSTGVVQDTADRADIDSSTKIPTERLAGLPVTLSANEARDVLAGLMRDAEVLGLDRNRLAPMVKNPTQAQIYIQRLILGSAFRNPSVANVYSDNVLSGRNATFTSLISDAAKAAMAMRMQANDSTADSLGGLIANIGNYLTSGIPLPTAVSRAAEQGEAIGDHASAQAIATRLSELVEYRAATKKGTKRLDSDATSDNWNGYLAFLSTGISGWTPNDMFSEAKTLPEAIEGINNAHRRQSEPAEGLQARTNTFNRSARIRKLEGKRRQETLTRWESEELTQLEKTQGQDFMEFFDSSRDDRFALEGEVERRALPKAPVEQMALLSRGNRKSRRAAQTLRNKLTDKTEAQKYNEDDEGRKRQKGSATGTTGSPATGRPPGTGGPGQREAETGRGGLEKDASGPRGARDQRQLTRGITLDSKGRDSRLVEEFGENWSEGWDDLGLPILPDGITNPDDPLLRHTKESTTAELPPESIAVTVLGLKPGIVSRQKLREAIINYFISGGYSTKQLSGIAKPTRSDSPWAMFMGGGGAAGKTSALDGMIAKGRFDRTNSVLVNCDEVREFFPEYEAMNARDDRRSSFYTHAEASMVADEIQRIAREQKLNIIKDGTMRKADAGIADMKAFQSEGYKVSMLAVTIDPHEALIRSYIRGKKTKRFVPNEILLEAHKGFNMALPRYIKFLGDAITIYDKSPDFPLNLSGDDILSRRFHQVWDRQNLNENATKIDELLASYGQSRTSAEPLNSRTNDAFGKGYVSASGAVNFREYGARETLLGVSHEQAFPNAIGGPETKRFTAAGNNIHWTGTPDMEDVYSVQNYMDRKGKDVVTHKAGGSTIYRPEAQLNSRTNAPSTEFSRDLENQADFYARKAEDAGYNEELTDVPYPILKNWGEEWRSKHARPAAGFALNARTNNPDQLDMFATVAPEVVAYSKALEADGITHPQAKAAAAQQDLQIPAGDALDLFGGELESMLSAVQKKLRSQEAGSGIVDDRLLMRERELKKILAGNPLTAPPTESISNQENQNESTTNGRRKANPTRKPKSRGENQSPQDGAMGDLFSILVGQRDSERGQAEVGRPGGGIPSMDGLEGVSPDAGTTSKSGRSGSDEEQLSVSGGLGGQRGGKPSAGTPRKSRKVTLAGAGVATERPPVGSPGRNIQLSRDQQLAPRGTVGKLRANIEAIRIIKALADEKRLATAEEKQSLVKFSGWGALSQAFDDDKATLVERGEIERHRHRAENFRAHNDPYYTDLAASEDEDATRLENWKKQWLSAHTDLNELLSPEEYRAAKHSTINAHFTSPEIIGSMWDIMKWLGFKGGNVLEPGAGIGHFFGLMPEEIADRSKMFGVELDSYTAKILSALYPEADIQNIGYQKSDIADNSIDLAISNVPFANIPIADKALAAMGGPVGSLHDYYFGKTLMKLKPGGMMAFITSAFTMDKGNPEVRKWLAERADLVTAYRLPNNAFKDNAGTDVVTDIIVLRKKDGNPFAHGQSWTSLGDAKTQKGENIRINEFFSRNPKNILGFLADDGSMYGDEKEMTVHGDPSAAPAITIQQDLATLPTGLMGEIDETGPVRNGSATIKMGNIVERDGQFFFQGQEEASPSLNDPKTKLRVRRFLAMRDALNRQYDLELSETATDEEISANRIELNTVFDRFVADHKDFHAKANRNLFSNDPDFFRVLGAEVDKVANKGTSIGISAIIEGLKKIGKKEYEKADIFKKRVLEPRAEPTTAETVNDAFGISLGWRNRVDLDFMAGLLGKTPEQIERSLLIQEIVVKDPETGQLLSREQYLAGNVRKKLVVARASGPDYAKNVALLEPVQPERVGIEDIDFGIGATWIPAKFYNDFMSFLGVRGITYVYKTEHEKSEWEMVKGTKSQVSKIGTVYKDFETDYVKIEAMVDSLLNQRSITVNNKKDDGGGRNEVATKEARDKAVLLSARFVSWVAETAEVRAELEETYNEEVNAHVQRKYDGQFLTFPWASKDFDIYPDKKNSVWRALQTGFGLIAHGVGGGKTIVGTAIALEMRRLGMARKPMIVVHNATLEGFAKEIARMAPTARVLVGRKDELEGDKRREFLMRIASGDWDAVVIAHSTFGMIADDPEIEIAHARTLVDEAIATLADKGFSSFDAAKAEKKKPPTVKALVKQIERLEAKITKARERKVDDGILNFQQLGVDALIVDEVHKFKKIPFSTQLEAKGIDGSMSDRAFALFMRARQIQSKTGGKNIFSMTGTPITNTLGEIWNMIRLVAPTVLRDYKVELFDQFVSKFARVAYPDEMGANGEYKKVDRLSDFVNLPEWVTFLRQAADVKLGDDLVVKNRPGINGGAPELVVIPKSKGVTEWIRYIRQVLEAAKSITGEDIKANPGLLAIGVQAYMASKAAAVDIRLIEPRAKDEPGSKVNTMLKRAMELYTQTTPYRGTQVIFSDTINQTKTSLFDSLIPRDLNLELDPDKPPGTTFSLYEDIRQKLIAQGVLNEEIAVITDPQWDNADRKQALFEMVNSGKYRFIIGSTEKLGTGVNMQGLMIAAHQLDAPWTPAEVEQRDGRVFRQGNIHGEMGVDIELIRYGMKDTLDAAIWQKLATKQKFSYAALSGRFTGRSLKEDDGTLNLEEQTALLSGAIGFRIWEINNRIAELRLGWAANRQDVESRAGEIERAKNHLRILERMVEESAPALDRMRTLASSIAKNGTNITVNGEKFETKVATTEAIAAAFAEALPPPIADKKEGEAGEKFELTDKKEAAPSPVKTKPITAISVNGTPIYLYPEAAWETTGDKRQVFSLLSVAEDKARSFNFGTVTSPATLLSRLEELGETVEAIAEGQKNNAARTKELSEMPQKAAWDGQEEYDRLGVELIEQNVLYAADLKAQAAAQPSPLDSRSNRVDPNQKEFSFDDIPDNHPQAAEDADKTAMARFKDEMPQAMKVAGAYSNIPGVDHDEIAQTARIALAKAAREFDPERGKPFSAMAGMYVRNALRSLYKKEDRRRDVFPVSLDEQVKEEGLSTGSTRGDFAPDTRTPMASDSAALDETRSLLDVAIAELPERMQIAVRGFLDNRTMEDIAKDIGVTKQAVNHLQKGAFERIRRKMGEKGISSAGELMSRTNKPNAAQHLELAKDPEKNRSELQRMVDEQAERNGWDAGQALYHGADGQGQNPYSKYDGTKPGDFTAFTPNYLGLTFFAKEKPFAETFPRGNNRTSPRRIITAYLKRGDYFDAGNASDLARLKKFVSDAEIERAKSHWDAFFKENPDGAIIKTTDHIPSWHSIFSKKNGWQMLEHPEVLARLKKAGFDGIKVLEGDEDISSKVNRDTGLFENIGVFDPNRIKVSDPVTYDENGKIIPLSERFNPETNNILHSRASDAAGYDAEIDDLIADLTSSGKLDWDRIQNRQTQARAEDGSPNMKVGRPDLAYGAANTEVRGADQAFTDAFLPETEAQWEKEAADMLARDYPGTLKAIQVSGLAGETLSPAQTKAAAIIAADLRRKMLTEGTDEARKVFNTFWYSYRSSGTTAARAMAARRDPFQTPAQRYQDFLLGLIMKPRKEATKAIEAAPSNSQKDQRIADLERKLKLAIAQSNAFERASLEKQIVTVKAEHTKEFLIDAETQALLLKLKAAGITPEDIMKDKVSLSMVYKNIKAGFKSLLARGNSNARKEAFELILKAKGFADIAKQTGLPEAEVRQIKADFIAAMRRDHFAKFQAGAKADGAALLTGKKVDDATAEREFKKFLANFGIVEDSKQGKPKFDVTDPAHVMRLARAIQHARGEIGIGDMIFEYWIMNILSGPQTHVANITGNTGMAALNLTVQRGAEAIVNLAMRDSKAASLGEFKWLAKGLMPGISKGFTMAARAWSAEQDFFEHTILGTPLELDQFDKIGGTRSSIPGTAGKIIRIPGRALLFADSMFKTAIGTMEAGAHAYRIAKAEGLRGGAIAKRVALLSQTRGEVISSNLSKSAPSADMVEFFARQLARRDPALSADDIVADSTSDAWTLAREQSAFDMAKKAGWTEEAWTRAVESASVNTFQQDLKTSAEGGNIAEDIASKIQNARFGNKLIGFFFPFVKTPFNVFRVGLRKSPLGSLNLVSQLGKGLYSMKNGRTYLDGHPEAVRDLAEQALAWGAFALLFAAAQGDDDDDDKWLLMTGSQPVLGTSRGQRDLNTRAFGGEYVIRIGGRNGVSIPYGRLEPIATVLGTTVDTIRAIKRNGSTGENLNALWSFMAGQMNNKSFLQGMQNVTDLAQGRKDPASIATRTGLQFLVPNLIRQPLRNIDDYARDTQTAPLAYMALPAAGNAEPKVNVYGEEVKKGSNPLARIFFQSPLATDPTLNQTDALLLNWNRENPEEAYGPEDPKAIFKGKDGKNHDMTAEEAKRFRITAGRLASAKLRGVVNAVNTKSPKAPDIDKIRKAFTDARSEAKDRIFTPEYIARRGR